MLYTSLTTVAGFASLALTPDSSRSGIRGFRFPWSHYGLALDDCIYSCLYVMLIPQKYLENFGMKAEHKTESGTLMGRFLSFLGRFTFKRFRWVLAGTVLLAGVSVWGISLITINDNPTRWFESRHPIRVADKVLNEHFGGTYMGYLALESTSGDKESFAQYVDGLNQRLANYRNEIMDSPHSEDVVQLVTGKISELRTYVI